jgi:MtrB/PioB family decaheme-associated outer membrane protein
MGDPTMPRTPKPPRAPYALVAALAAAAAAALGPVPAGAADEVPAAIAVVSADEIGPTSTVWAGLGYVTPGNDVVSQNQRFGQFSGMDDEGVYGLLDIDLNRLDAETGTWLQIRGRDLGLDSREVRVRGERQGDWGYTLEYSRTPRNFPYDVNTGLTGAGTASLTTAVIVPGGGNALDLGTRRELLAARVDKVLPKGFDVKVSFRNEQKDGTRLFGRTGIDFLAEPIDYTTRQWEAVLSYAGTSFQVSGGYYGTTFGNADTGLVVDGVTDGPNNVYSPIGLPPDNVSHQLYLNGGYSFGPATRADFDLSVGRVTQNDAFISTVTVAPGVGPDLDGEIRTTRVSLGLTSRPAPRLTLRGNLRREDRDDRTPVLVYYTGAGANSRTNGENEPRDFTTTAGKVEAVYRLPASFRLTGGITQEDTRRNISEIRSVSARSWTRETAYRAELARAMSSHVNGAVAYVLSVRDGSDFKTNIRNGGTVGSNSIAPVHYADRRRDQVRVSLSATPSDRVSLQLVADQSWDGYDSRTSQELGVRKASGRHLSADAAVQVARAWQVTVFVSHDRAIQRQNACDGISSSGAPCVATDLWSAELINRGYAAGLGVRGKAGRVGLGADVQASYDKGQYHQSGTPILETVEDLYYRPLTVSGFADLALTPRSGVALSATYDRRRTNDWSWVGWTYADGTTLYQDPNEEIVFVGARYHRTWN